MTEDESLRGAILQLAEAVRGDGATLRDRFAMAAMTGILSADKSMRTDGSSRRLLTHEAYAIADAMLSERNKP